MGDENIYSKPAIVAPSDVEIVKKPIPPLTAAEKERVQEQRRLVHQLAPEMVTIIEEFHKLGLIDGWRSVSVTPLENNTDEEFIEYMEYFRYS